MWALSSSQQHRRWVSTPWTLILEPWRSHVPGSHFWGPSQHGAAGKSPFQTSMELLQKLMLMDLILCNPAKRYFTLTQLSHPSFRPAGLFFRFRTPSMSHRESKPMIQLINPEYFKEAYICLFFIVEPLETNHEYRANKYIFLKY